MLHNEFIDACKLGDLEKVKNLVPQVNINDTDDFLSLPAIFHAAYEGHFDIVTYLYDHGASLAIKNPVTIINFLYCACTGDNVKLRKKILNWLIEKDRYLEIGNVTRYHVDAALGILPNLNDASEIAKIGVELDIDNFTVEQFLNITDSSNTNIAKYAIISGFDISPQLPLEKLLTMVESKENFIIQLLIDRRLNIIKKLFESGLLAKIDFNRDVKIGNYMYTNLLFTFAIYAPSVLIDLYDNNQISPERFLNLNYKIKDLNGNPKGASVAYELMKYTNTKVTSFVMKLAEKMKDNGELLDVNESASDSNDKSFNISLAQLFIGQDSEEELDKLLKWGAADQIINFNLIPTHGRYVNIPYGVLCAINKYAYFKKHIARQLKMSVPDVSREEKIEKGWLLDVNKLVTRNKELLQGVNMAWVICHFDPLFLEELLCSAQYKNEILNLDVCPGEETAEETMHNIAIMLAVNKRFQFIELMVDRDKDKVYQVSLNKHYFDANKNKTRNLATLLAKNNQFDLLEKLADRNPTEQVELNPIGDSNDVCVGFCLLTNGKFALFKKFLDRQPANYIFKLNSLTIWILANHDISLLRRLMEREKQEGNVIDLEFGAQRQSIRSVLEIRDKGLLKLIDDRNERVIAAGIQRCKNLVNGGLDFGGGAIDIKRNVSITAPKKAKISLAQAIKDSGSVVSSQSGESEKPEAKVVLKEKIENLLQGKEITVDVAPNKDKFEVTFSGSENNIAKLNSILKKYFNDKHFDKKNATKVTSILISTESHLNSIFNDNALKKLLVGMQITVPNKNKKAVTSQPDKPALPTKEKDEPVVLNDQKQTEWRDQLAYAFCKSDEVKINWDVKSNVFIIKLPTRNKAWSLRSASEKFNNLGYIVEDAIIEAILKPLRNDLSGIAKIKLNIDKREIIIEPKQTDIISLKRLQEINYSQIKSNCESIVLERPDQHKTYPKLPKQDRHQDAKSEEQPVHKIRTAELKGNFVEFLSSLLKDIDANRTDKAEEADIRSFSFLENLKSEIVDECRFSISMAARPTIGIFTTKIFINAIANHFNNIRRDFMRIDCDDETKTMVITMSKRAPLHDVFGAQSYQQLKNILNNMQFNEQERRLGLLDAEGQELVKLRDAILDDKENAIKELTQVQQELIITLSRINENDMTALDYHFDELKDIQTPKQTKGKDGNLHDVISANDQVYYHLYLLHTLQIMRILSTKIKKEDNVFWLMRNNILHAYKRLDWCDFYQKVDELIKTLNDLITSRKMLATTSASHFFATEARNDKYHKFESLLTKLEEKHDRRIARQAYNVLLDMMHHSDFSYKKKRDFTMMIYTLMGETSDKHPERTIRDALAHSHVHEYEKIADEIYREFILVEAPGKKTSLAAAKKV